MINMRTVNTAIFSFFISIPIHAGGLDGWNIPSRLSNVGRNSWTDLSSFSAQIYIDTDELYKEGLINVAPSSINRRVVFQEKNNEYSVTVFGDYSKGSGVFIGYTWGIVINSDDSQVIYLNGLRKEEIVLFLSSKLESLSAAFDEVKEDKYMP